MGAQRVLSGCSTPGILFIVVAQHPQKMLLGMLEHLGTHAVGAPGQWRILII